MLPLYPISLLCFSSWADTGIIGQYFRELRWICRLKPILIIFSWQPQQLPTDGASLRVTMKFLQWVWWNIGVGCPEKGWMLHPWKIPKLDGTLSNLMEWKMFLLIAEGWTQGPIKVSSNANDSVILRWSRQ